MKSKKCSVFIESKKNKENSNKDGKNADDSGSKKDKNTSSKEGKDKKDGINNDPKSDSPDKENKLDKLTLNGLSKNKNFILN